MATAATKPARWRVQWRWIRRQPILRFGVMLSGAWLLAATILTIGSWCWSDAKPLSPNELGDYLAGVFAPLAFMWLALGLFAQMVQLRIQRTELKLQRKELALQREETTRLADEAARQAKAIEANEAHVRRDVFMKTADLIIYNLNVICSRISDAHYEKPHQYIGEWQEFSMGRKYIFFDRILTMRVGDENAPTFNIEQVRKIYPELEPVKQFCEQAEFFFRLCQQSAPDLRTVYEDSALGLVYLYFCKQLQRPPKLEHLKTDSVDKLRGRW